jgi:hypothetical protein
MRGNESTSVHTTYTCTHTQQRCHSQRVYLGLSRRSDYIYVRQVRLVRVLGELSLCSSPGVGLVGWAGYGLDWRLQHMNGVDESQHQDPESAVVGLK